MPGTGAPATGRLTLCTVAPTGVPRPAVLARPVERLRTLVG